MLIMVGGFLRRREYTFVGHIAEQVIQNLRLDKVIIGIRGIHPIYGLTSDYPQELMTDRGFLRSGENVIVVADHTKFGFVASGKTAPITAVKTIITTKKAPCDIVEEIREKVLKYSSLEKISKNRF
jgi:DeoR/GlpR family transcriptional regulator of sugar metabolism